MNEVTATSSQPAPLDAFQAALLHELRAHVARRAVEPLADAPVRRPRRRRRTVLAAAASAALVSGIWWSTAGSPPAFAVTRTADGDVNVVVSRIDDPAGLQRALREKGITADVQYLPWGKGCAPGRFTEVPLPRTGRPWAFGQTSQGYTFTVPAAGVRPGQTLVLELTSTEHDSATVSGGRFALATGPVGVCSPVDVPVPALPLQGPSGAGGS
jgi:hypothetical protein